MLVNPQHVLWPTDFSELSMRGGRYARGFCEVFGAELHIIHVLAAPLPGEMTVTLSERLPVEPPEPDMLAAARAGLAELVAREFSDGVAVHTDVIFGSAWARTCKYAQEHDIDLIIVATHGRAGIRHVLIGSTAERIVQHAPCPVLVVKDPEREFLIE